jgi:hypothetical protein
MSKLIEAPIVLAIFAQVSFRFSISNLSLSLFLFLASILLSKMKSKFLCESIIFLFFINEQLQFIV